MAYNEYHRVGKVHRNKEMSYSDYLDYWIDTYCNFNLKYSTIVTYLKPRLGHYKLGQLDAQLLQEFINNLYVEKNLSKWYLKGILKIIKGSLKYACYTVNFINDCPAERVHIPRYEVVASDPAHIFTQEEIERILDRFKDNHSIYYAFLTAYYTGMRVSEVYGLTWDCVDFERKTITINKNIIKKNKYGKPKKYTITKGHSVEVWFYGSCKNPQSNRVISIGDTLKQALINYRKRQDYLKEIYGTQYKYYHLEDVINEYGKVVDKRIVINKENEEKINLVFTKDDGTYIGTDITKYPFKIIHHELGITKCRFYDLRGTYATKILNSGTEIKDVATILGHTNITTTGNYYISSIDENRKNAVKNFDSITKSEVINEVIQFKVQEARK